MKYLKLTFLISTLLLAYSCTDLDEVLEDDLTSQFSDDGVTVIDGATDGGVLPPGSLLAAYNRLRTGTANSGTYYAIQTVSSDEQTIGAKGGDWFDGGIWVRMHRHTILSASSPVNNTWTQTYEGIGEVNLALSGSLSASLISQSVSNSCWAFKF